MMAHPYEQYRLTVVETATPVELVVKLYEGVLRFTQRGIQAIEAGDLAAAHNNLVRAQAIVAELAESLDMELGGDLAPNLMAIYDYAYGLLVEANCQKVTGPAVGVVDMFRPLLGSWRAIVEARCQTDSTEPVGLGQPVMAR